MSHAQIAIYTTPWCGYCSAAKALLTKKNARFEEIDATSPDIRMEMIQRAQGRRTVPQIFIGDRHIGGFDDLWELDRRGGLDALLCEDSVEPAS